MTATLEQRLTGLSFGTCVLILQGMIVRFMKKPKPQVTVNYNKGGDDLIKDLYQAVNLEPYRHDNVTTAHNKRFTMTVTVIYWMISVFRKSEQCAKYMLNTIRGNLLEFTSQHAANAHDLMPYAATFLTLINSRGTGRILAEISARLDHHDEFQAAMRDEVLSNPRFVFNNSKIRKQNIFATPLVSRLLLGMNSTWLQIESNILKQRLQACFLAMSLLDAYGLVYEVLDWVGDDNVFHKSAVYGLFGPDNVLLTRFDSTLYQEAVMVPRGDRPPDVLLVTRYGGGKMTRAAAPEFHFNHTEGHFTFQSSETNPGHDQYIVDSWIYVNDKGQLCVGTRTCATTAMEHIDAQTQRDQPIPTSINIRQTVLMIAIRKGYYRMEVLPPNTQIPELDPQFIADIPRLDADTTMTILYGLLVHLRSILRGTPQTFLGEVMQMIYSPPGDITDAPFVQGHTRGLTPVEEKELADIWTVLQLVTRNTARNIIDDLTVDSNSNTAAATTAHMHLTNTMQPHLNNSSVSATRTVGRQRTRMYASPQNQATRSPIVEPSYP